MSDDGPRGLGDEILHHPSVQVENPPRRRKRKVLEQPLQSSFLALQVDVMPEAMGPGHGRSRLVGVELPWVEVEHYPAPFTGVDASQPQAEPRIGQQAEPPS